MILPATPSFRSSEAEYLLGLDDIDRPALYSTNQNTNPDIAIRIPRTAYRTFYLLSSVA